MTVKELHNMNFNEACEALIEQGQAITTKETLISFCKEKIDEGNYFVAIHILQALHESDDADYYGYDYCMGTLETPTPLLLSKDLEYFCED